MFSLHILSYTFPLNSILGDNHVRRQSCNLFNKNLKVKLKFEFSFYVRNLN